ncbi:hypothetical protein [Nocardioides alpinus]|uniref:hypothetical protein n=1 Tax=Nocardioides alpinus TaxID=748909 RepID=UPI0012FEF9AA|nr:hypothetical protein [Nocardioides alpinus]
MGYLWLVLCWIWFSDELPAARPSGDGLVARVFELSALVGSAATIGAISFVAYLLGALLTLSFEGAVAQRVMPSFAVSRGVRITGYQYRELVDRLESELEERLGSLDGPIARRYGLQRGLSAGTEDDLRARLLVANQELYGEYDRLAAESTFRLNVCPALLAGAITAGIELWWGWLAIGVAGVALLVAQGVNRYALSMTVLRRAVLNGAVEHPYQAAMRSLEEQEMADQTRALEQERIAAERRERERKGGRIIN